jgi:hypothetical protein
MLGELNSINGLSILYYGSVHESALELLIYNEWILPVFRVPVIPAGPTSNPCAAGLARYVIHGESRIRDRGTGQGALQFAQKLERTFVELNISLIEVPDRPGGKARLNNGNTLVSESDNGSLA